MAEILQSPVVAVLALAVLGFVLRNWFLTRLTGAIGHEYARLLAEHRHGLQLQENARLESLRAASAREVGLQNALLAAVADTHHASHSRRLQAIAAVWKGILQLRSGTPSIITMLDAFPVGALAVDQHLDLLAKFSDDTDLGRVFDKLSIRDIEVERPFAGEPIFALLLAYQALPISIAFRLREGMEERQPFEWRTDPSVRETLAAVLDSDELKEFDGTPRFRYAWVQRKLEAKILSEMNAVTTGERSSTITLDHAKRISEAASALAARSDAG